ncbi:MAG TPA: adenylate/guanylate cyclase domain-containing protein [Gaiellaceae bacterium]|jgi:class 3 adenylate cyclase
MSQVIDDPVAAGREAAGRGAWQEAYDLFLPVEKALSADDLVTFGETAFWTGHLNEAIQIRERAYAAYLEAGDEDQAAVLALWISRDYFGKADLAISGGWFAQAERLLEGKPDSPAKGYLAVSKGLNAMMGGDLEEALEQSDAALEASRRFGDRNLGAMALVGRGRALILRGDVDDGLKLLDEATAAAIGGELEPWTTGLVYCTTITSCQGIGDMRRAAEWTKAANSWCDRLDVKGFPGACRVHHATLTRLQGDWSRAEEQAVQACEELQGFDAWTTAAGFYEVGEIRRRRGDFAAAEESYGLAKEWGRDPQPGLALLRLAQGKTDAATAAIKRSLGSAKDPLGRIKRLPAQVEIALAGGELKTARAAAEELEQLADAFLLDNARAPAFDAAVHLAWGQIRLYENDAEGAVEELEGAVERWRSIGAPYETADAQTLLGLAFRRIGEEDAARDELRAAKSAFEKLGAALATERAAELLGEHTLKRTFMFTDIVDSTRYVELLGEDKWRKLLAWHDKQLGELIETNGGEVIKQTGDGYFAAFQNPTAALEAAIAIQRTLDEHEPLAPDVRIGVHTGGAFHRSDDDYAGQGVHMAARIGALAKGGEIVVSKDTVAGVSRYPLSKPLPTELKGIEEPIEVCSVEWRA